MRYARQPRFVHEDCAIAGCAVYAHQSSQTDSHVTGDDAKLALPAPTPLALGKQLLVDALSHDFPAEGQAREVLRRAAAVQRRTQEYDSPRGQPHTLPALEQF